MVITGTEDFAVSLTIHAVGFSHRFADPQPDEEGESDVEMGVGVFDLRFCDGANEPCA